MTSFISKIKKHLNSIKLDDNLTEAQHLENFKHVTSSFIKTHLSTMDENIEEINTAIRAFFKKHGHESVAQQDSFSEQFEKNLMWKITAWVGQDEGLRDYYKSNVLTYGKKLKSVDMLKALEEELENFESEIKGHVLKANKYGIQWTNQMDNSGLILQDRKIKNTIKWFKNLTIEEYKRDIKK